ncbi:retinol dehydrogenase 11-like [Zerene cesonia]|uniref:retinol dehydrogenase 11-like n=1 Tax=Zerene cesonia TaxID=33412 RepID=UPI0018E58AAB|nr:retinol dehydrogenase 11-like [Zerene cesonia]
MCKCTARLDGKIVLVTGGNSGIGFETAKDMANRGARVIIADVNNAEQSVRSIVETTGNKSVEYRHVDLADFKSVRAFAEDINKTVDHLDILVNNAGCFSNKNNFTKDGVELTMQVNYLGPFLLTYILLESLAKSKSRIVIVSSGLYYKGEVDLQDLRGLKTKSSLKRYMNSKLCTVLWTKGLVKKMPQNVSAFCLHPGMVRTNILKQLNISLERYMNVLFGFLVKSSYEGAQTIIHACIAPNIEKMSGGYFSDCELKPTVKLKNEEALVEDLWNTTILFLKQHAA